MKKYRCILCSFIYDEEQGYQEGGISPKTKWEDVPSDWLCPDCGVTKAEFMMVEISKSA